MKTTDETPVTTVPNEEEHEGTSNTEKDPLCSTIETRLKSSESSLNQGPFERLRHQRVHVRANGFHYEGVLIGADGEQIYLRCLSRYVVLPMDRVTSVTAAEQKAAADPLKHVDAAFYAEDPNLDLDDDNTGIVVDDGSNKSS